MKIGILSFSEQGLSLGHTLAAHFSAQGHTARAERCQSGGLDGWTREHFSSDDALVFIGSCGIAVRAIAPHVHSKLTDPAVAVVDELGTFSISLLSGHLGGANRLAEEIAQTIGATPVVTTATDRNQFFAVDTWAKDQGLFIAHPERIKAISAGLLAGEAIGFQSDIPVEGALPPGLTRSTQNRNIIVTHRRLIEETALHLVPPVLSLGVGCRKGTSFQLLEASFKALLAALDVHPAAIAQVCTIDLKAREPGLLTFCQAHSVPLRTYTAQQLLNVPGTFTGSDFVKSIAGVDNVCERSAVLGSGPNSVLLKRKTVFSGVTMALAMSSYSVTFEG